MMLGTVRTYSLASMPRAWSRKAYDDAADVRRCAGVFSAGAVAQQGRRKNAGGGGGPTTSPTWINVGAAGDTGGSPAYNATNNAGDLFVMVSAGRITAHTTPSNWTLRGGGSDAAGRGCWLFTRDARSTGSESGSVAISATGGSYVTTIHTFRDVATSSFVEDESSGGRASNGVGPEPPAITAGGNFRLAVFASGDGNQVTYLDDISGETGGTWVLRNTSGTGTGSNSSYGLYTADLASGGTVTGGTGGVTLDEHHCRGFALVGV